MKIIIENGKKGRKIEFMYGKAKVVIGIENDNLYILTNMNVNANKVKKYVEENLEDIVKDLQFIIYYTRNLIKNIITCGKYEKARI